jgi:hypothetical protein
VFVVPGPSAWASCPSDSPSAWIAGSAVDAGENTLHSVAASVMGFAFAFGGLAVAGGRPVRWRWIDVTAVVASVALPLAMARFGSVDGVLQRAMFVVAFCWYGTEAMG